MLLGAARHGEASRWRAHTAWTREALLRTHGTQMLKVRHSSDIVAEPGGIQAWRPPPNLNVWLWAKKNRSTAMWAWAWHPLARVACSWNKPLSVRFR